MEMHFITIINKYAVSDVWQTVAVNSEKQMKQIPYAMC
jgi:hypothetical protein